MSEKIQRHHLEPKAILYDRQELGEHVIPSAFFLNTVSYPTGRAVLDEMLAADLKGA